MKKGIHIDCPFTQAEIDEFNSMLYNTAARNNLPAHKTWVEGFNRSECRKVEKHNDAYKEYLLKELESIEQ
jgi:hypothetical protein